jgi:DNA-binding protein H-NS
MSVNAPTTKAAPKKAAAKVVATPPSDLDKMLTALEGLSVPSLRKVMETCERILDRKSEGERKTFIEEVTTRAAGLGMSIADLLKRAIPDSVGLPGRGKKAAARRASPAVKFRDPATGYSWSGRGRPARWITDYEKAGRKREEFAV